MLILPLCGNREKVIRTSHVVQQKHQTESPNQIKQTSCQS